METEETAEKEQLEFAEEVLTKMLSLMGFPSSIEIKKRDNIVILSVEGCTDSSRLIGKEGHTLEEMQFIINRIVYKKFGQRTNMLIDVDGYRERRLEQLRQQAFDAASQVKQEGNEVVLNPMNSFERRTVHMALADDEEVLTESINYDVVTGQKCVKIFPAQ